IQKLIVLAVALLRMTRMIKTKQLVKTNELPYRFYMAKNSHQLFIQQKGNSLLVFMNENNRRLSIMYSYRQLYETSKLEPVQRN
ncbi:MAG: hypothetical protein KA968_10490, partial [Chitinophagaceae bacterium]|nr:hypothetical protein [Chitinophagaceae bacterium]